MVTRAANLQALAEKDAIEIAIRHEADPGNLYSRGTIDTAGLVKRIKRRHEKCFETLQKRQNEMRKEKEDLRHEFNDEKERLCFIIRRQNAAMRSRDEEEQQTRKDYLDLQPRYKQLLEENNALKEEIEDKVQTCKAISKGSVDALTLADRRSEFRIARIERKCRAEVAEIRACNVEIQKRLDIARRLQPVILIHRAQVGTVCEMNEKLVQFKKTKVEELAAKDTEIKELQDQARHQEREIRDLKITAQTDGEILKKTNNLLSETRTSLSRFESKIGNHDRQVKGLENSRTAWEKAYESEHNKNTALRSEMRKLEQDQSTQLILAQADNANLQIWNEHLKEAYDKMDEEFESREHGHRGSLRISQAEQNNTHSTDDVSRSLAEALKAANHRANTLQVGLNALNAEKGVLERRLRDVADAYNPQVLEQLDHLQSENQILLEAKEAAATKMTELITQLAKSGQEQEERFADRARKLEAGFTQGFEDLRKLRDQWLLHKRSLEEQHNRNTVAENLRREIEYRLQEDQLAAAWKVKVEELQGKEEDLQNQEKEFANQASNLSTSGQTLFEMTARAEQAEKEVIELRVVARDDSTRRNLIEKNLNNEAQNQRRAAQRHLDLLNEETSKMPEWSRIIDLHNELQQANCSMNNFVFNVTCNQTNSETLSQMLFGADFEDYDVSLLQGEGRPRLLSQLRGAKQTLNTLRRLLAQSPTVDVDRALSIVMAPRGDEGVPQPADDIFDQWDGNGQSAPQTNPRKRSGAPSGGPTYGDHEDNTNSNDWGDLDQDASSGARISTPEEVSNRQRILPKSRRNGGPANTVPLESIDPIIRYQ